MNLTESLQGMLGHLEAAKNAAVRWWTGMSRAERRQARQKAAAAVACGFALVAGMPLVAQRFDVQKSDEAYRAEAVQLAQTLRGQPSVQLVSFTNRASSRASVLPAAAAGAAGGGVWTQLTLKARDTLVLGSLARIPSDHLGLVEREQMELDCLAEAVYYEARSESMRGQMAVAEVVMNRVRDKNFPKTVCEVVYQGRYRDTGCQFTFTCDGSLRHKPFGEAWDRARQVALHVALGLSRPVTNNATHYHTDYVNPYWKAGMVETASIGTHIFYRFPRTGAEVSRAQLALASRRADAPPASDGTHADDLAAAALMKVAASPSDIPAAIRPPVAVADARPL